MLDSLLDMSMQELVEQLPLSHDIKLALLERKGPFGDLLTLEECFESADWNGVEAACQNLNIPIDTVMPRMTEAQRWSNGFNNLT